MHAREAAHVWFRGIEVAMTPSRKYTLTDVYKYIYIVHIDTRQAKKRLRFGVYTVRKKVLKYV